MKVSEIPVRDLVSHISVFDTIYHHRLWNSTVLRRVLKIQYIRYTETVIIAILTSIQWYSECVPHMLSIIATLLPSNQSCDVVIAAEPMKLLLAILPRGSEIWACPCSSFQRKCKEAAKYTREPKRNGLAGLQVNVPCVTGGMVKVLSGILAVALEAAPFCFWAER